MNTRRRLERLEAENTASFAPDPSYWAAQVLFKHHERLAARREGREPPPYTPEEIAGCLRTGGGNVGEARAPPVHERSILVPSKANKGTQDGRREYWWQVYKNATRA